MQHLKLSALFMVTSAATLGRAQAQQPVAQQPVGPQVTVVDPNGNPQEVSGPPENPIPPNVEGTALQAQGGGYCFGGPHPAPGGGWEATTSPHMHDYAPFDLRLFSLHEGCYYFIGDPHDFGYTGESYNYYGAHPIADGYGGGWCFMIGAHTHWWRPWSPYFTVVGPWYYWNGPYDPFFWSFWPYYSFFYRSYYPGYYGGGRFFRTGRAAPAIAHVPATGWRGGAAGGWRGAPGAGSGLRANGVYGAAPGAGWRGASGAGAGGWRGAPAAGGWRGSPVPGASSALRAAPMSNGGWRGAPAGGGWHPAPSSGGFRPAPSSGGWHGSSGGGFHGGGGGFHSGGGFHGGRR